MFDEARVMAVLFFWMVRNGFLEILFALTPGHLCDL